MAIGTPTRSRKHRRRNQIRRMCTLRRCTSEPSGKYLVDATTATSPKHRPISVPQSTINPADRQRGARSTTQSSYQNGRIGVTSTLPSTNSPVGREIFTYSGSNDADTPIAVEYRYRQSGCSQADRAVGTTRQATPGSTTSSATSSGFRPATNSRRRLESVYGRYRSSGAKPLIPVESYYLQTPSSRPTSSCRISAVSSGRPLPVRRTQHHRLLLYANAVH